MHKIISIFIFAILFTGCSVKKQYKRQEIIDYDSVRRGLKIERADRYNISLRGFYIQKAEIEVSTKEKKERFICTVKQNKEGKYLISIKNITGIEAARIYLTNDTILINDRINRNLYFGSANYMQKKLGINTSVFSLIFGDIFCTEQIDNDSVNDLNGYIDITCSIVGVKVMYYIEKNIGKSVRTMLESNNGQEKLLMNYKEFKKVGNVLVPHNIVIDDSKREMEIVIKIRKMVIPWNDTIDFIPGSRYEHIELL